MAKLPRGYDVEKARRLQLHAATVEHYEDPELYDHEYRRRRADVNYYRALAARLPERAREVLELGCGSGRLLVPLLRDGARVVGVDYSQPMLRRCAERVQRVKPRSRATLIRGDFRSLALGRRFPLVVCPFNAMMHLYSADDFRRFFSSVKALLAPGGTFAFDVLNPDPRWLARDPDRRWARTRFKDPRTGQATWYSTNHTYDGATQIAWIRIFYDPVERSVGRVPRSKIVHLAHRQIFPQELLLLLDDAGLSLDARDGGFAGEPFESESDSQVCRCSIVR